MGTLAFAPHISLTLLWVLIGLAVVLTLYGFYARARGAWARGLAFLALILALANPLLIREHREPLRDVAVIVVDPVVSAEARPPALIDATAGLDDAQVT